MLPLSLVIITKNEEGNIARCLQPWIGVCKELLVVDNGSTDASVALAETCGARVVNTVWKGYGPTKNEGNQAATHDWILSLDADEIASPEFIAGVKKIFLQTPASTQVFSMQRKLCIGNSLLHFGSSKNEFRIRLFNRRAVHWNDSAVHEELVLPPAVESFKIEGFIQHHSYASFEEQAHKMDHYAQLSAQALFQQKRRFPSLKKYASSLSVFLKNYLLRFGFLDGKAGWTQVRLEMRYAYRKYAFLEKMFNA
jgi:hypothetical protein